MITLAIGNDAWTVQPEGNRTRGEPALRHTRAPALGPQYRLNRYELLCAVGQGGMADVWAARRHDDDGATKLVAIKTILPEYAHDSRFRAMFLDEGRISSRIEHPNVARILDLGEESNQLYLVMEWINGDSLSQLRRRLAENGREIPLGILLRVLADLAGGLHAAHELCDASGKSLSVVHRDVSPENILVDTEGVSKLIDFGVAKARDRAAEETKSGILKGKIAYMAPEQALKGQADRRADIWAVGSILYKFLSGKAPFQAENQAATLCLLVAGENPAPLPSRVHPAVAKVVHRALRHDPAERYATAAELQRALMNAMVEARVPTTADDVAAFVSDCMAERIAARRDAIAEAIRVADGHPPVRTGMRPAAGTTRKLSLWPTEASPTETERDATTKVGRDVDVRKPSRLSRAFDVAIVAAALTGAFFLWRGQRRHPPLPPPPMAVTMTEIASIPSPASLALEPDVAIALDTTVMASARSETPVTESDAGSANSVIKNKRGPKPAKSNAPAARARRRP
jgi:serine/threonine protein kinase